MKLSEAIMKGVELYPVQCFGELIVDGPIKQACALGCAYGAMVLEETGHLPTQWDGEKVEALWPELKDIYAEDDILYTCVCMLNDTLQLTRESIAEWLRERGW